MSGHGHVIPRQDGVKARCGGPALCSECAAEALLVGLPGKGAENTSAGAILDVVKERFRQVMVEGWTAGHDDQHDDGELARAAACYANPMFKGGVLLLPTGWPWAARWWKSTNRRRDLVKAAALLIAEIERLDRKEKASG
jgi:hypothetical protein